MTTTDPDAVRRVTTAVRHAGRVLLEQFEASSRPRDRDDVAARVASVDAACLAVLRPALEQAWPGAGWVDDELEEGELPPGDWWVVDPAEGAVNYVHGLQDWCVSAALVRDNAPLVAAVHVPLADATYVAVRGGGATLDGDRLQVSAKIRLDGAMVGTGQASPRDDARTRTRLGGSAGAVLHHALTTRMSVPATWQLLQVAAGQTDGFWQFSGVRSGLCAGALLVAEAGGTVTDVAGRPWRVGSPDFVAAAPGLHADLLAILSTID